MLPPWNPVAFSPPSFVLHVSVPLEWWFSKQILGYANNIMIKMISNAVAVPSGWSIQLAEILRKRERARQTNMRQVEKYLAGLYGFQIFVDNQTSSLAWGTMLPAARSHGISTFDAAYLELALRLKLPLATTDAKLSRSATAAGVPIYTP